MRICSIDNTTSSFLKSMILFVAALFCVACGVKAPPVPKDSIHVPVPLNVVTQINDGAIVIYNGDATYSLYVERAEQSQQGIFKTDLYKRITMILPGNSYSDTDVKTGDYYTYKLSYYNAKVDVFSQSTTKTLHYITPVSLNEVTIEETPESACVIVQESSAVKYSTLAVNGKSEGVIENGKACFKLPNSLTVDILIIPYDFSDIAGVPYQQTLKRNPELVLLPPQNIRAVREQTRILISWDSAPKNTTYKVYRDNSGKLTLLVTTDISLYNYSEKDLKGCIKFAISSVREGKESAKTNLESCP